MFKKLIISIFISFAFLMSPSVTLAYFESATQSTDNTIMNGISFKKYSNFTSKWKLVTFRFREDSGEIRITYANDKAWQGLKKLKPAYEDGAMFAKVSYLTEQDPAFPSSRQPTTSARYQFMQKNKKKFKETDGWGYALFNSKGSTFSGEIKEQTMACAACHRVVPERDFVFSRAVQLDPNKKPFPQLVHSKNPAFRFALKKMNMLDENFKSYLKDYTQDLETLEGDIQKHGFSGTLSEITPLLIEQSRKSSLVSALFLNSENFTIVRPLLDTECKGAGQKNFHVQIVFNNKPVSDTKICQ